MKGIKGIQGISHLSSREQDVVRHAAQGHTDNSICNQLGIAPGTLGTHWARIRIKTGLSSRPEMTAAYARHKCEIVLMNTVSVVAEGVAPYGDTIQTLLAKDVFETLPISTFVVDEHGGIVAMNAMAAADLGPKARTHDSIFRFLRKPDQPLLQDALQSLNGRVAVVRLNAPLAEECPVKKNHWIAKRIGEQSPYIVLVLTEFEH